MLQILLSLPICNQKPIEFIDALFTSVSSVCVTGLVTIVPAEQFTLLGKIILLLLIQVGGLGVIACMSAFFLLLGKKINMKGRITIQQAYGLDTLSGLVKFVIRILKGTFLVEGMSATPIPRTLGLLMYGDLDISILDELPPGRKPVKTRCITGKKRADLYGFLDREIDSGRQVYIVCPAIEDAGGSGLNAVKSYYEDIAKAYLPDRRVGLMHGKLKPKEKAEVMDDFKSGRLDALVSTTVIEVGVDVPNATVMVIENAERYGLSALHQLRGRVGRGAAESWCFLVSDNASESVQKRLKFLCSTSDGFAVAQYDLETRGPGDFFGSRQHGLPTLQIADLMNDTRTLHAAQSEAVALLAEDPLLQRPEHALLARQVEQMFDKAGAMN